MQLLLFGFAINQDVRHLRAGVADLAATQRSRPFVADAQASQVVDIVATLTAPRSSRTCCAVATIVVGILIPPDFERRVAQGDRPAAQLLVDGSDPVVLAAARGLADLPVPRDRPATHGGRAAPSRCAPTTTPSAARRCRSCPDSSASSSP